MNNEKTRFCTLEEIAGWQLNTEKAEVGLPALQRGYVWKPKQVETLWDSLLRGFPIGSFLLSHSKELKGKKDLLDGQQRATVVALGFYNPWENAKQVSFFSDKFKNNIKETVPIVWLDVAITEKDEKGDLIFLPRLVTQSHPWGFNHNGNILGIASRRKANEQFEGKYPHYNLKDVFPWDAILPIPLVFLIEAIKESIENWREKVIEKSRKFLSHIRLHYFDESTSYITKLQEFLNDKDSSDKIEEGISMLLITQIPVILLNNKQFEDESNTSNVDASTLFVRINTLGTPLNGEELIYSIFKTVFPKSKEIVEAASTGFIAPSRIITLISRIALTDISKGDKEEFKFYNQLNLKQFKNAIKDKEGLFYSKMKQFAENEALLKFLFDNAKSLLVGEKEYQLPFPLAVEIARNQDVFFIFLYWIYKSNINIEDIMKDEELHKKILAAVTVLNWFVLDMNSFLNKLASTERKIEFWDPTLFSKKECETRNIVHLLEPNIVRKILLNKINNSWDTVFNNDEDEKNKFVELFNRLNWQRSMLFFAQRQYFNYKFKELQWNTLLEDTNRPYDWDHIYPDNWWVYNIPNNSPVTKEWRWSIGNFRALTLEVNRSEGNKYSPKERLEDNCSREDSFITKDNWYLWQQVDGKIIESQVEILAKAIVNRVADVYENWCSTLNIAKLFNFEKDN